MRPREARSHGPCKPPGFEQRAAPHPALRATFPSKLEKGWRVSRRDVCRPVAASAFQVALVTLVVKRAPEGAKVWRSRAVPSGYLPSSR